MPVRELLRGLAGALVGFFATLVLLLCLVETRERFNRTERGVAWLAPKDRVAHFGGLWWPLVFYATPNAVLGYVVAVRLTGARRAQFAVAGVIVGTGIMLLIPSPLPREFGRAGENTVLLLDLLGAFLGAAFGTLAAERWERGRRRVSG